MTLVGLVLLRCDAGGGAVAAAQRAYVHCGAEKVTTWLHSIFCLLLTVLPLTALLLTVLLLTVLPLTALLLTVLPLTLLLLTVLL